MIEHRVQFDRPLAGVTLLGRSAAQAAVTEQVAGPNDPSMAAQMEVTQELLAKIAEGIGQARSNVDSVAQELSSLAISLAGLMVKQLGGHSREFQDQRLTKLLTESVKNPETAIAIHLNSENHESVKQSLQQNDATSGMNLIADSSIPVGECRIQFKTHELVSSLASQLNDMEVRLKEVVEDV